MRRVATVLMAGGCTLAGALAWGAAARPGGAVVMPARGAAAPIGEAAAPAWGAAAPARTTAAGAGTKRVAFAGYTIDVPAGWPVYRLARDPYRCVRYDQNAVYLGQPGANQQCPAHLAGRVRHAEPGKGPPHGVRAAPVAGPGRGCLGVSRP
jgi:hypothetical protein